MFKGVLLVHGGEGVTAATGPRSFSGGAPLVLSLVLSQVLLEGGTPLARTGNILPLKDRRASDAATPRAVHVLWSHKEDFLVF